jgi:hypothetical protein
MKVRVALMLCAAFPLVLIPNQANAVTLTTKINNVLTLKVSDTA